MSSVTLLKSLEKRNMRQNKRQHDHLWKSDHAVSFLVVIFALAHARANSYLCTFWNTALAFIKHSSTS